FVLKMHDAGVLNRKSERFRQLQTEVLVLNVSVQIAGGWLENMGRGLAARGNAPTAIFKQQRGFWLGPRKTELAGITGNAPGRVVGTQQAKPRRDCGIIQPFDLLTRPAENCVQPF